MEEQKIQDGLDRVRAVTVASILMQGAVNQLGSPVELAEGECLVNEFRSPYNEGTPIDLAFARHEVEPGLVIPSVSIWLAATEERPAPVLLAMVYRPDEDKIAARTQLDASVVPDPFAFAVTEEIRNLISVAVKVSDGLPADFTEDEMIDAAKIEAGRFSDELKAELAGTDKEAA